MEQKFLLDASKAHYSTADGANCVFMQQGTMLYSARKYWHNPKATPSNSNPTQKKPKATWLWGRHDN